MKDNLNYKIIKNVLNEQDFNNLYDNNRLNGDLLYYRKMTQMTWDDAKQTYLGEVGR